MKSFSIDNAAKATGGKICGSKDGALISSVTMDSRLVKEGSLFVAIKGERVDGHDFIKDVLKNGAAAVLCDHVPEGISGPCIVVPDTVKGLQEIARWYRSILPVKVVGITGSVGKTSTKEMIASVLAQKYNVLKTEGNFNNEIGLPLTIMRIRAEHEVAVLEMGISDFDEMHRLIAIGNPVAQQGTIEVATIKSLCIPPLIRFVGRCSDESSLVRSNISQCALFRL